MASKSGGAALINGLLQGFQGAQQQKRQRELLELQKKQITAGIVTGKRR